MSLSHRIGLSLVVSLGMALAGCGSPPDREMQQAKDAIEAARAAGADQYARDELAAAQDLLTRAGDAVGQRDYRLALNYALDSLEQAQNAARLAADAKALARGEADRALATLVTALARLQVRLKAAQALRTPARALADPREAAADGERRVQEARTAIEKGDYTRGVSTASEATTRLDEAERKLAAAGPPGQRRRR